MLRLSNYSATGRTLAPSKSPVEERKVPDDPKPHSKALAARRTDSHRTPRKSEKETTLRDRHGVPRTYATALARRLAAGADR